MYECLLILHFLGLALGVGTGFANLNLAIATKDLAPAERVAFMLRAASLSKNSSIGLLLLLVSGVGLVAMRGMQATFMMGGGAFHAKLGLVAVLFGLHGYLQVLIKRARQAQGGPAMAKIPLVGRFMLPVGLLVVITAVFAFH